MGQNNGSFHPSQACTHMHTNTLFFSYACATHSNTYLCYTIHTTYFWCMGIQQKEDNPLCSLSIHKRSGRKPRCLLADTCALCWPKIVTRHICASWSVGLMHVPAEAAGKMLLCSPSLATAGAFLGGGGDKRSRKGQNKVVEGGVPSGGLVGGWVGGLHSLNLGCHCMVGLAPAKQQA